MAKRTLILAAIILIIGLLFAVGAEAEPPWECYTEPGGAWDEYTLSISGNGNIGGFTSIDDVPWKQYLGHITRIVIDGGITGIGKNTFAWVAGTNDPVRVDFRHTQSSTLTIDPDAFGGTNILCRYYDEAWTNRPTVTGGWLYLPYFIERGFGETLYYDSTNGWHFRNNTIASGVVQVTVDQIDEILFFNHRSIELYSIPNAEEFEAICSNWEKHVASLTFAEECGSDGTQDVTLDIASIGSNSMTRTIYCNADINLAINAEGLQADDYNGLSVSVTAGNVTVNSNIGTLDLSTIKGRSAGNVTVTGDIYKLMVRGEGEENRFMGDLSVQGTIRKGGVTGNGYVTIPNIDKPIPVSDIVTCVFNRTEVSGSVVVDGEVNSSYISSQEDLMAAYTIDYEVNGNPLGHDYEDESGYTIKAGANVWYAILHNKAINRNTDKINLSKWKPGFSAADMKMETSFDEHGYPSKETTNLTVNSYQGTLVVPADTNGKGLYEAGIVNSRVVFNCPVSFMIPSYDYYLTINNTVYQALELSSGDTGTIILGENGNLPYGGTIRRVGGWYQFDQLHGPCIVKDNGTLQVMSHKSGQTVSVILPSDQQVTGATEDLGEGEGAGLDFSVPDSMSAAEEDALAGFINEYSGQVESTVEVTVEKYVLTQQWSDAGHEILAPYSTGGRINELRDNVEIRISKMTEAEDLSIVRLHEKDDGTIAAERLKPEIRENEIAFRSNRFSKFVLVSGAETQGATLRVGNKTVPTATEIAAAADTLGYTKYSGSHYYKLYFDFPYETETFQMGWGGLNDNEPDSWMTEQVGWFPKDDGGRFILSRGSEKTQSDAIFIRMDEEDPHVFKLGMEYAINATDGPKATITGAENGTVSAPELSGDYEFSWTDVGNADVYFVNWEMPNGQSRGFETASNSVKLSELVGQDGLAEFTGFVGEYTLGIDTFANNRGGYAGETEKATFTIAAPEADKRLTLSVNDREMHSDGTYHLLLNDAIAFSVQADPQLMPNAAWFVCGDRNNEQVDLDKDGFGDCDWLETESKGEAYTYNAYVRMWVPEPENETGGNPGSTGHWIYSNTIPVKVITNSEISGDISYEVFGDYAQTDGDNPVPIVPRDGILTLKVYNMEDVKFFGAYIEEDREWIADSHWHFTGEGLVDEQNRGYTIVNLPVAGCEEGQTCEVHVFAVKLGAPHKIADQTITIQVGQKSGDDSDNPIVISMKDEYETGEPLWIRARYEDADRYEGGWIEVRVTAAEDPTDELMQDGGDPEDFWCDWFRIQHAGYYDVRASFCVKDPGDDSKSVEIAGNTKRIHVISTGAMPEAVFTELPAPVMSRSEATNLTVKFRFDGKQQPDQVAVELWKDSEEEEDRFIDYVELRPEHATADGLFTYTYNGNALDPGEYRLGVGADKRGLDSSNTERRFIVMDSAQTAEGAVTLKVNGTTANGNTVAVQNAARVPVEIQVTGTAPDTEEPLQASAVRILYRGQWEYWKRWESEDGEDINHILTEMDFHEDDMILIAQATFDELNEDSEDGEGFSWNGLNWVSSKGIRVTTTAEYTLNAPDVELWEIPEEGETAKVTDNTVTHGSQLEIRITPQEAGEWYWADLDRQEADEDGNLHWEDGYCHLDWNESTRTIRIPTSTLAPGPYRIRVGNEQVNYRRGEKVIFLTVEEKEGEGTFTGLIAEFNRKMDNGVVTVLTNEEVSFFVRMENADRVGVTVTFSDWDKPDERIEENEYGVWGFRFDEPGDYTFTPFAIESANNDDRTPGAPVTLRVRKTNDLADPVINTPIAYAGEDYTFTVENTNPNGPVNRWFMEIREVTDGQWPVIMRHSGSDRDFTTSDGHMILTETVDKNLLEENHDYQIFVGFGTEALGYVGSGADAFFTVISAGDETAGATMARRGAGSIMISEEVLFDVTAPAGHKTAWFFDGYKWQHQVKADDDDSNTFVFGARFYSEGEHSVQIMTSADKPEDENDDASYQALHWVAGDSLSVMVTALRLDQIPPFTMKLPMALTQVEDEAFAGVDLRVVIISEATNRDLSFLNEYGTMYVVGDSITIPSGAEYNFRIITTEEYDAMCGKTETYN